MNAAEPVFAPHEEGISIGATVLGLTKMAGSTLALSIQDEEHVDDFAATPPVEGLQVLFW